MSIEWISATYRVLDFERQLAKRAEGIAIGLTVGSWTDVPAVTQAEIQKHCGQVQGVRVVKHCDDGQVLADITIGYPTLNFTNSISSILTTVFGKLSLDGQIRLVQLELPQSFSKLFQGPKFGVEGVRKKYNVYGRPLTMSIFKSCVGRSLPDLTDAFREQARGGVDLIKDDEIFFTEAYASPEERVVAFMKAAKEVAEETGRETSYAVNLTGPVPTLFERARKLADLGAGALLLNVFAYGYDVLQALAEDKELGIPIMAHPAISGALFGSRTHGIASHIVLGQLLRLAGADIVLYPSPYGSVTLPADEARMLQEALTCPSVHKTSLPAPAAGIYPGLVPTLYRDYGKDFIVNAGGGIHGHPNGSVAGGKAFVDAVTATVENRELQDAARTSEELQAALDKWGLPE